ISRTAVSEAARPKSWAENNWRATYRKAWIHSRGTTASSNGRIRNHGTACHAVARPKTANDAAVAKTADEGRLNTPGPYGRYAEPHQCRGRQHVCRIRQERPVLMTYVLALRDVPSIGTTGTSDALRKADQAWALVDPEQPPVFNVRLIGLNPEPVRC